MDNAPIKNTCPIIDDVINYLHSIKSEAEYIKENPKENSSDEATTILDELFYAISIMEDIREANATLRDWGNEEFERAEDAEEKIENANSMIQELNEEIESLKSEFTT